MTALDLGWEVARAGWPDLFLTKRNDLGSLVAVCGVEVKSPRGRITARQRVTHSLLKECGLQLLNVRTPGELIIALKDCGLIENDGQGVRSILSKARARQLSPRTKLLVGKRAMIKAIYVRGSVCACGFPVLKHSIAFGKIYHVDPKSIIHGGILCGGCGMKSACDLIQTDDGGWLPIGILELAASAA